MLSSKGEILMSEMQPVNREDLPHIVDVMAETHTHSTDWVMNGTAIANALKVPNGMLKSLVDKGLPARTVIGIANRPTMIILKADLEKWIAEHPRPTLVPQPRNVNGGAPPLVLTETLPFVAKGDFDKLLHAQWETKAAIQSLNRSVDSNSSAQDANTRAIRDQIAEMRRIFDGEKK